jgi:hypothetical protein
MKHHHQWIALKGTPWPYCKHCGLVRLRNVATDLAVARPCSG